MPGTEDHHCGGEDEDDGEDAGEGDGGKGIDSG